MAHAVGIDAGTTNVKAALVAADGTVVASTARALTTQRDGEVSEQDAGQLWTSVVGAVRELTDAQPKAAADVVALGCCSQYSSIVPVDADGLPVAPMVLWSDQRGTDHCWEILALDGAFERFMEHHGVPPIGAPLSQAHVLHLQKDRPELLERTAAWLEPMDYLNARLTGRLAANQASMWAAQVIDNRTLGATDYDAELVELAGIDAQRLPPLIRVDDGVGPLRADVAADLGLPADVVVYAGLSDSHTGAVATDVGRPGRGGLMVGTTTVFLDTVTTKGEDIDHEILAMPSAFDDQYLVNAENGIGGRALEHVLRELVFSTDPLADHTTDDPFAGLDATLASVEPGSGGVVFLPWLDGALAPRSSPAMRGAFLNLSLHTGRAELVRAVAEGVAHNLAWLLPFVEAFTGEAVEEVAMVGGASRSPEWVQIFASVLGRPVAPVVLPDRAVARATGLLALQRHGTLSRDDLSALAAVGDAVEPDPAAAEGYAHRQAQFEAAYDATLPILEALNP